MRETPDDLDLQESDIRVGRPQLFIHPKHALDRSLIAPYAVVTLAAWGMNP